MSSERIVIVGYKPLPGKENALIKLIATHVPRLREEGLVSEREAITMQAKDGTILEVFGWVSKEAIEKAHTNPVIQKMWAEFSAICEYIPGSNVEEMQQLFSEFSPI
jgi:quinol monooxygenase YgiN